MPPTLVDLSFLKTNNQSTHEVLNDDFDDKVIDAAKEFSVPKFDIPSCLNVRILCCFISWLFRVILHPIVSQNSSLPF